MITNGSFVDWQKAQECYLLVFNRLRSNECSDDSAFSEAVKCLRTLYSIQAYVVCRRPRQGDGLEDIASAAWSRFVVHCLTSDGPYRSFHSLVDYHINGVAVDDFRQLHAQKRNDGKPSLSYDENQEGEPESGVISAMSAPLVDLSERVIAEELDALVARALITQQQRDLFWSYVYEDPSITQLTEHYGVARASIFRYVKHVSTQLRIHMCP